MRRRQTWKPTEGRVSSRRRRTVLITGGTGSVGESLVAAFAGADYQVVFLYHEAETRARVLAETHGVTGIRKDLSEPDRLGSTDIDVLVNNAAINQSSEVCGDVRLEDWNRTIAINLTAPFLLVQQCLPHMVREGWGRIVNVSSIYGLRGVETNLPYTVSKHGLSGLTKTVAREYGRYGIRCNEICPGPIESRLLRRICAEGAARSGIGVDECMRDVESELPTGSLVRPSDVAGMAVFLAGEGGAGINGASIVVDGGMIA